MSKRHNLTAADFEEMQKRYQEALDRAREEYRRKGKAIGTVIKRKGVRT